MSRKQKIDYSTVAHQHILAPIPRRGFRELRCVLNKCGYREHWNDAKAEWVISCSAAAWDAPRVREKLISEQKDAVRPHSLWGD